MSADLLSASGRGLVAQDERVAGDVVAALGHVATPRGGRFPVSGQVGGNRLDARTAAGYRDRALI